MIPDGFGDWYWSCNKLLTDDEKALRDCFKYVIMQSGISNNYYTKFVVEKLYILIPKHAISTFEQSIKIGRQRTALLDYIVFKLSPVTAKHKKKGIRIGYLTLSKKYSKVNVYGYLRRRGFI